MITLSEEKIKELAGDLDIGLACFLNKHNGEIVLLAGDENDFSGFDDEDDPWADDRKKIEDNPDEYIEIEKMDSRASFLVMTAFTETVDSIKLRLRLMDVLEGKKPFMHFKSIIDNSDHREDWFKFKDQKMQEWVKKQIEDINEDVD